MADKTSIEWTEATWNPVVGCKAVSAGCDNCYAAREASGRLRHLPQYAGLAEGGVFTGEVRLLPERLDQPLRWQKPRKVFVNSMSDLFHADVPDEFIARVFGVMAANLVHTRPTHTFQVLTKRHGRMRSLLSRPDFREQVAIEAACRTDDEHADGVHDSIRYHAPFWPLPNVWLGVSAEDQKTADLRIPALLDTPAAVRWVSAEPLLGPIDMRPHLAVRPVEVAATLTGFTGLDWVVVGGESGHNARPMHPDWPRSLRDQCVVAGVPFLFKQRGEWTSVTRPTDPWYDREPDAWVNKVTGAVGTEDEAMADGGSWSGMHRVGKKAAGRELDGWTWDEYPDGNDG